MTKPLPRINFSQLTENVEQSNYFVHSITPSAVADMVEKEKREKMFPAVPPKLSAVDMTASSNPDEKETWYLPKY